MSATLTGASQEVACRWGDTGVPGTASPVGTFPRRFRRALPENGRRAAPAQQDDGLFEPFKVIREGGLVIVKDLPLVDEHTVFDEDGNFVCECDVKMLQWIAANNNRRVEETGDEVPVTVGHTLDDAPEHKQPPVVGWCSGFFVAPLVNPKTGISTGRHAIYARTTTFTEEDVVKHDLKRYGRRSVEIWFDKDPIIDPVALLSSTTPERDLGVLRLQRGGSRVRCGRMRRDGQKIRCGELGMIGCKLDKVKVVRRQRFGNVTNYPSDQDDIVARILAELMNSEPMKFLKDLQEDPGMMEAYLARHSPEVGLDMMPTEDLDQNNIPDVLDETGGPQAPPAPMQHSRYERGPARYQADGEQFADDMGTTLNGGGDMPVQMSRNGNGNTHVPHIANARNGHAAATGTTLKPPSMRAGSKPVRNARDDEDDMQEEEAVTVDEGADGDLEPEGDQPGDELDMEADEFASEDSLADAVDEAEGFQGEEMDEGAEEFSEELADVAMDEEAGHTGGHECPHCGGAIEITENVFAPGDEAVEDADAGVTVDEFEDGSLLEEEEEADSPIRNAAQPHEIGGNPEQPRGSMFRTPGGRLPQTPPKSDVRPHNVGGRTPAQQTVNMPPLEAAYANSGRRPGDPEHFPGPKRQSRQSEYHGAHPANQGHGTESSNEYFYGNKSHGGHRMGAERPLTETEMDIDTPAPRQHYSSDELPSRRARAGEAIQRKKLKIEGEVVRESEVKESMETNLPKKPIKREASGLHGSMRRGAASPEMSKPVRNSMGGSTASGTNSFTPSGVSGKKSPSESDVNQYRNPSRLKNPEEVEHLSRKKVKRMRTNTAPQPMLSQEDIDALRQRLDHLENENHGLRQTVDNLRHDQGILIRNARSRAHHEKLSRRRAELAMAQAEGYDLDIEEEMGTAETHGDAFTMSEPQWQNKMGGIRKRYQKTLKNTMPIHPGMMVSSHQAAANASQQTGLQSKDEMWAKVNEVMNSSESVADRRAAWHKANGVA